MSLVSEKDLIVVLTYDRTSGLFYRVVWVLRSLSVTATSNVAALSLTKPVSAGILHDSCSAQYATTAELRACPELCVHGKVQYLTQLILNKCRHRGKKICVEGYKFGILLKSF